MRERFDFMGMQLSGEASYFSRFVVKFVEIIAAGIATAVSGYLIAHIGGFLSVSVPVPAAVQVAPSTAGIAETPNVQPGPAATIPSATIDVTRQVIAPEAKAPTKQPARTTVNATQAASHPKHAMTDAGVVENRRHDKERNKESVEAEVRAALANVDAKRPAAPEAPSPSAEAFPPAVAGAQPAHSPAEVPLITGAVAVTQPPGAIQPQLVPGVIPQPQPVEQVAAPPDPLAAVEVKSRPIAAVVSSPEPVPAAQENHGLLSTIARIPDMLRPRSPPPAADPPRPPLPVGE